jgi:hypothetical protein
MIKTSTHNLLVKPKILYSSPTRSRRIILHLPHAWPYQDAVTGLFAATHAPPHTA